MRSHVDIKLVKAKGIDMGRIKMKMTALACHSVSSGGAYALILSTEDDTIRVPIIIGKAEVLSIASMLEKEAGLRPFIHDMVKALVERLGGVLEEVFIYRFQNGIFDACVTFGLAGGEVFVTEMRASDAVALSLRCGCPIFMDKSVVDEVGLPASLFEFKWADGGDCVLEDGVVSLSEDELRRLMEKAVSEEDYEKASRYRDMLKAKKDKKQNE